MTTTTTPAPKSTLRYEIMLVLASAIWGLGTIVIKDTVDEFPTAWLVGIRFLAAGILLSLVLLPRMRKSLDVAHIKTGAILGVFLALTYLCNTTGLAYTTASRSSFLTATYCVLVPFLTWILIKKRPTVFNLAAALLCLIGVGFVALPASGEALIAQSISSSLLLGDSLTLLSAIFCGTHIVLIAKFAPGRDMLVLTALQFIACGLIALACAACTQEPPTASLFGLNTLSSLVYLIVPATCLTLIFQNVGLAHVAPAPASLLLSTEAVFGVIFSVLLLSEALTFTMVVGFVLIFAGILVSEWLPLTSWGKRFQE